MKRDISRADIVTDRAAYAEIRPALRKQAMASRALRRVRLGDAFALAFENAETLHYQVQEILMVEGVTDEAAVAAEIATYSRLLPTSHSLVATLFFEHDDIRTVKDELLRLTGAHHAIRLDIGGDPTADLPARYRVAAGAAAAFVVCNMDKVNMSVAIIPMAAAHGWDGATVGAVQARVANGATLLRITGDSSADVQERLYRWLSRPVVEAQFDGKITAAESATLRDDIARAVDRLMRQPGGSDGKVAVSPRRN